MTLPALPAQHKKTGGQREEGHGVVHHIQGEYHANIQDGLIQLRMNQSSFFFIFLLGGGPLICQALSPNP